MASLGDHPGACWLPCGPLLQKITTSGGRCWFSRHISTRIYEVSIFAIFVTIFKSFVSFPQNALDNCAQWPEGQSPPVHAPGPFQVIPFRLSRGVSWCLAVSLLSKLPFLACKKQTVRCPRRAACCSWWNKKSAQGAAKQINFFVGSIELLAWKLRVSWCQLIEFCNHICQIGTAWHACLSLKILKERDCTEGNRVWW